ncbi:hypothetical protein SMACR_02163 [Sordaria macrospora]|uniref:WGS project CABT00000000 data, contig 2.18 n=2 Tax=Sordaria macrospora TaxID=5147 RepID=F7W153_SORMK|nr:uncharacterized protein SMAC_02163 [Sordaria macrospora k-hell]KAA8633315.1 hypothetical protein SMACR_02163 [Sordaria macrospora]WPJ63750.1 hypothetical protein SMAC4_02163 [Sordaria macrospora]CCC11505.1 unnamed protein product [Sordaria macrospora k-hell]
MTESQLKLEDWLDDLCVRFIINLPQEDLRSVERICFQVEEAQWFYEDFIRPLDAKLPQMSLRTFCLRIFAHCPLLSNFTVGEHTQAFERFMQYKTRIPVRGAILLNDTMDHCVLVKGWKKNANWSFPRGKINKDEDDLDCAIREVYEETGLDIREAGLVPKPEDIKPLDVNMKNQQIRLYVFRNVPMDTVFQPKTRKEISKVEWYRLSDLPSFKKKGIQEQDAAAAAANANKFYMVAPFLGQLKKWVAQQKKKDAIRAGQNPLFAAAQLEEPLTEDDLGTQTETMGEVPATSSKDTLEGANRELRRLLSVQGSAVDPQPPVGMHAAASNTDKGGALMALLKKSETEAPQQAQATRHHVPNTPLDLTYQNPPEPETPLHHHIAQRLPVPNFQPPPNFPLPPQASHNPNAGYYNQPQPPLPVYGYGQNQYMNAPPPQRKEPVLLHPQPLPPQVQQSMLTRGILGVATPNLPDTTGQKHQQPLQASLKAFLEHSRRDPMQGQMAPNPHPSQLTNQAPNPHHPQPQLTNQAQSLLNVFKGGSVRPSDGRGPGVNTQENIHPQMADQPRQQPPGNWQHGQQPSPAGQYYGQHAPQVTQPPSVNSVPHHGPGGFPTGAAPRPIQPVDSHRNALLDMFKKTVPASPSGSDMTPKLQTAGRPDLATRPDSGSQYNVGQLAQGPGFTADANAEPVPTNAEHTLPYRPQILARPKPQEAQELTPAQLRSYAVPASTVLQDLKNSVYPNLPSAKDRLLRQQAEARGNKSPVANLAAAAGQPYNQDRSPQAAHVAPSFQQYQNQAPQVPNVLQQHQQRHGGASPNPNPEQRNKLLELFGKAQPSPPVSFSQPSPAGSMGSRHVEEKLKMKAEPVMLAQARSRVPSFASTSGGELAVPQGHDQGSRPTSSGGSQTPISPTDRNFLLSYLKNIPGPR